MKISNFSALAILFYLFVGCKHDNTSLKTYIDRHCDFKRNETIINLKDVFHVDYDTMYIFDSYSLQHDIEAILGMKYQNSTFYNSGYIVNEYKRKIILLKKHEIVYDSNFDIKDIDFAENTIERKGIFDNDTVLCYATLFTTALFKVTKRGQENNHQSISYFLEPVP